MASPIIAPTFDNSIGHNDGSFKSGKMVDNAGKEGSRTVG